MNTAIDALAKVMKTQGCLMALAAALILVVGLAAFEAAFSLLLMWAWNVAISGLFHGPHITFWQALAIWVLLSLATMAVRSLFGSSK